MKIELKVDLAMVRLIDLETNKLLVESPITNIVNQAGDFEQARALTHLSGTIATLVVKTFALAGHRLTGATDEKG